MIRRADAPRPAGGWLLIDLVTAVVLVAVVLGTIVVFVARERLLVDNLRRLTAIDAVVTEQIERLRATPFSDLVVGKDQPVDLAGLDARLLRDVTCTCDVEPFRPDAPDLLRVTVRAVWRAGHRDVAQPMVRSRTTLIARRDYGEGG